MEWAFRREGFKEKVDKITRVSKPKEVLKKLVQIFCYFGPEPSRVDCIGQGLLVISFSKSILQQMCKKLKILNVAFVTFVPPSSELKQIQAHNY